MSYANILSGLQTRLETLAGLTNVLLYEPASIDDTPMAYLFLDNAEIEQGGQVVTALYAITVRVIVRWQENDQAEAQIAPYADSVVDAIRADPSLGSQANSARVTAIEGGFLDTGNGIRFRVMDFTVRVKDLRT
jgi:hypothetical protein